MVPPQEQGGRDAANLHLLAALGRAGPGTDTLTGACTSLSGELASGRHAGPTGWKEFPLCTSVRLLG